MTQSEMSKEEVYKNISRIELKRQDTSEIMLKWATEKYTTMQFWQNAERYTPELWILIYIP